MSSTTTSSIGYVVNARKQFQSSLNQAIPSFFSANKKDEDKKYNKGPRITTAARRRVVRRKGKHGGRSIRDSIPKMLGVMALLCTVLLLWHCAKSSIQMHRNQAKLRQRQRAADLLKERLKNMPHYETGGEGRVSTDRTRAGRLNSAQRQVAPVTVDNEGGYVYWEKEFEKVVRSGQPVGKELLLKWLQKLDLQIRNNSAGGVRWIRPYLLPPIEGWQAPPVDSTQPLDGETRDNFFYVSQKGVHMKWEDEWDQLKVSAKGDLSKLLPYVDYTRKVKYTYPKISPTPPPADQYPPLRPLKDLMFDWPQDHDCPRPIKESLMHFNYSDPAERAMAQTFRDSEIPFKFYDVPEIDAATLKWTDEYLVSNFESRLEMNYAVHGEKIGVPNEENNPIDRSPYEDIPQASGAAQESADNYFAFFNSRKWEPTTMGLAPVRNNDWDFEKFIEHARYADAKRLSYDQPHFYWQSGVDKQERHMDYRHWTFISRDLPSLSSPNETFFVFHPESQKGIQCRFGERGVVAATHYDGGRNHIAMITGAKRYILSPPRECSKLGIFTHRESPIYRHSLLNFGHIMYLKNEADLDDLKINGGMTEEERAWLEKAGGAEAVETVLKAGEVLYVPSHWFHYIISLQRSAQCNVRAGIDTEGHPSFGNRSTVEKCEPWPNSKAAKHTASQ